MHSASGRLVIDFNGEIYNHAEIRAGLEAEGARFRSRSDTEVLLESLSHRGRAALEALRGMFAFALYDRETGDLMLARDRMGKRPLVYIRTSEYLAFASEAGSLYIQGVLLILLSTTFVFILPWMPLVIGGLMFVNMTASGLLVRRGLRTDSTTATAGSPTAETES